MWVFKICSHPCNGANTHTHIHRGRERKTECKNCDRMLTTGESRGREYMHYFSIFATFLWVWNFSR